jgi:hypothetical protein
LRNAFETGFTVIHTVNVQPGSQYFINNSNLLSKKHKLAFFGWGGSNQNQKAKFSVKSIANHQQWICD